MLEVIILSIVQGITEFLPISSSAHLILVSKYFNFSNGNLTLDISLHLGSLLAIVTYFRKDIFIFMSKKNIHLKILISSIPTLIIGLLLSSFLEHCQVQNLDNNLLQRYQELLIVMIQLFF